MNVRYWPQHILVIDGIQKELADPNILLCIRRRDT